MQLKNYNFFFTEQLSSLYPKTEIDTLFLLLVEEYLSFQRVDIVLKADFEIPSNKLQLLNNALKKLQNEEPIQYILGKTEFYGFPFLVDKNTLIPRPETEELVEWILQELEFQKKKKNSILDIGTGSGCIVISLDKKNKNFNKLLNINQSKKILKKFEFNTGIYNLIIMKSDDKVSNSFVIEFAKLYKKNRSIMNDDVHDIYEDLIEFFNTNNDLFEFKSYNYIKTLFTFIKKEKKIEEEKKLLQSKGNEYAKVLQELQNLTRNFGGGSNEDHSKQHKSPHKPQQK